ncbi:ATP-binding protein [Stackebrandtia soli]|uniref:ATP-binding protein n=1 Tax=Stackebrandtia soli TaxID=1892856 RepID=UPI0039ED89A9
MKWVGRHPGFALVPGAALAGVIAAGPVTAGSVAAGIAAGAVTWYRGHPRSWDSVVAPRMRSAHRRWLTKTYRGKHWAKIMTMLDLTKLDPDTKEKLVPRVRRIVSHSPSTETIYVDMLMGQTPGTWTDAAEALGHALRVQRVAVEETEPLRVALRVQRTEPFQQMIIPPEVPTSSDVVDVSDLYLGETEYGTEWRAPLRGQHWFISGATGSGKGSIVWGPITQLAPLIRDGLARLWLVDPKGTELKAAAPVAYRYAAGDEQSRLLIAEFWDAIEKRKSILADQGLRTATLSRETPLDVLVIDEMAAVLAYGGEPRELRATQRILGLILTQARALNGSVIGAVQEPTKEVVPLRDLFTQRVILRTTSSAHVDMVLGEDMRLRGGLADQIPNLPDTAGIGFVVRERSRTPLRVRAAYTSDGDIAEFVKVAGWPHTELGATTTITEEVSEDV